VSLIPKNDRWEENEKEEWEEEPNWKKEEKF